MIAADTAFRMMGRDGLSVNSHRDSFAIAVIRSEIEVESGLEMVHIVGGIHHILHCFGKQRIDRRDIVDDIDLDVDRELIAIGVLNDHFDGIGTFDRIGSLFISGIDRLVQCVVPLTVLAESDGSEFAPTGLDNHISVRRGESRHLGLVGRVVEAVFVDDDVGDLAAIRARGTGDIDVDLGFSPVAVGIPDLDVKTVLPLSGVRVGLVSVGTVSVNGQGTQFAGNVIRAF